MCGLLWVEHNGNKYPLPHIDELFDHLKVVECFKKNYLQFGYNVISVKEEDIEKIMFSMMYEH